MITAFLILAAILIVVAMVGVTVYMFNDDSSFIEMFCGMQMLKVLGEVLGAVLCAIFNRN